MAILRLEKELNRAREELMKMRQDEYQSDVNPDYKSSTPATKTAAPTPIKTAPVAPMKMKTSTGTTPNVNRAMPIASIKTSTGSPVPKPVNGTANNGVPAPKPLTFGGPAKGLPTTASSGNAPVKLARPGSVQPENNAGVNWRNTNQYKR